MRRSQIYILLIIIFIIVVLCGINIYLTIHSSAITKNTLNSSILDAQETNKSYTDQIVSKALENIKTIKGQDGRNGKDGKDGLNGKDGTTTTIEKQTTEYVQQPSKDGKDGREIILNTDPTTGDIMWKYSGDTLWNLLIEKCSLTNSCGSQ